MDFTLPYADDNISFMRKALIFIIAVALPLVGLCTSVYWDRGELSTLGYDDWEDTTEYFWSVYMGDWEGGGESAYMSIGFKTKMSGYEVIVSPGQMDVASEKWAKWCFPDELITEEFVKEDYFLTNTKWGGDDASFRIMENDECTFGYAVRSYGDANGVGADEWVYGWVTFVFEDGIPYPSNGCYVFGADGIYTESSEYLPRQLQPAQTPEPGTFSLVLVGIVALSLRRRV